MTYEDLLGFNGQPIIEEQLEEMRACDLVDDIEDNGVAAMYPELHWYIITLVNGKEINVFL